jgi:hypothetical protein
MGLTIDEDGSGEDQQQANKASAFHDDLGNQTRSVVSSNFDAPTKQSPTLG